MSVQLPLLAQRLPIWACLPVVVGQGLGVRRRTPRLPEAQGVEGVRGTPGAPFRLAVVGDSLAAGVGVTSHDDTVAGHLAQLLAEERRHEVRWRVDARNGTTAEEIRALLAGVDLRETDAVLISVGVNDTKDLHTLGRWRRELTALLDHVLREASQAQVVLLGVPPMERFPALPRPLADVFGARATRLRAVAAEVVASRPRVRHLLLDLPGDPTAFAADGFHPGPRFHRAIAEAAVALLD
ncbi:SGNH/GDSL hydrolase family protein [Nocardioides daejeonensis]|uniref:SGNH/GDSL hydrolase family protein n=1 Tax=Nocardioides daejeonensis TaxID=1046556 RepID=UPI000D74B8C1|nr:SGNH/GDSL hydrolase family protein [Nocardioides daejeonensis]